ncbi:UNVERIFIED_CONTAM: Protein-L-isoaspartate O-methyltransferase 1 [Sesamum radiatum]|uniref:Protein-L-isoaspartate O-methyltransferase 1 n=1 Tax=Sesamum radiatum TaxID=300843 RepID=A0AAW2PLA6_SESRA
MGANEQWLDIDCLDLAPIRLNSSCRLPSSWWVVLMVGAPASCMNLSLNMRYFSGDGISKNKEMVEHLQSYGVIKSQKVAEVMGTIDRGTGYLTACFAVMVGPQGRAIGVDHIPELAESSVKNIEKSTAAPLLKEGSLSIHIGDGRQGWPEFAPYDAIHVGAAAPEIPPALIEQLKPGGRLVIPVGNIFQDLKVVDKNEDGTPSVRSEISVRYIPLTSREAQLRGY